MPYFTHILPSACACPIQFQPFNPKASIFSGIHSHWPLSRLESSEFQGALHVGMSWHDTPWLTATFSQDGLTCPLRCDRVPHSSTLPLFLSSLQQQKGGSTFKHSNSHTSMPLAVFGKPPLQGQKKAKSSQTVSSLQSLKSRAFIVSFENNALGFTNIMWLPIISVAPSWFLLLET